MPSGMGRTPMEQFLIALLLIWLIAIEVKKVDPPPSLTNSETGCIM